MGTIRKTKSRVVIAFAAALALQSATAAEFISLGDLPGGAIASKAFGVSLDGNVVVGFGTTAAGTEAFRWTQAGGMQSLGDLAGGAVASVAYGVSMDGKVVVGQATASPGTSRRAFLWKEGNGMAALGDLPPDIPTAAACAVSADGKVVVGTTWKLGYPPCSTESGGIGTSKAFRWTETSGTQSLAPFPMTIPDGSALNVKATLATGISADGMMISGLLLADHGHYIFQWNPVDGMTLPAEANLNDAGGYGFTTWVGGISATGVGTLNRVSAFTGQTRLSTPAGLTYIGEMQTPKAVSADTTVVVGIDSQDGEGMLGTAKIWTKSVGTQDLKDFLQAKGLDLSAWTLDDATAISADGRTIVGYGTDPNGMTVAWRARY